MTDPRPVASPGEETRRVDLVGADRENDIGLLSAIGWRLAGVIALVSLVALGLLATFTLVFANSDVSTLSSQQENDLAHALASALAVSYRTTGSWSDADLSGDLALATHAGIAVRVSGIRGHVIATAAPEDSRSSAFREPHTVPIVVSGHRVGSVTVRIGSQGISAIDNNLHRTLVAAVAGSAAVVGLLAITAGFVAARRITRPIASLTRAARAMAAGEHKIRIGNIRAPGELAELSDAFDHMAETLEREDHLRRALVADVAHELRTPLAILQASTEALADGVVAPNAYTLSSLHDETLRLSRIVEDLEVLASADAAGLTLDHASVDLGHVAGHAADAMEARITAADLTLVRSLESVIVTGDQTRLHQVITNLLTNAAKFTPAGGQVSLLVERTGDQARLVVADTGIGIPSDELPHVFERFWRGRDAQKVAGSGIGLVVVAGLVEAHGGQVVVTSGRGPGTTFVVTLPLA
jgi:two-component system sensor histidine kinase BaeS